MKEEIQSKIDDIKGIIAVLPTNNKENREKKSKFIEEEEAKALMLLNEVENEINTRNDKMDALKENNDLKELEEELKKCSILNEWTTYNTSFEKMHLDYYLYQLHRYYRNDLVNTNDCIRKILEAFKNVGINLTLEDFSLHPYVTEYITAIQNNSSEEELSAKFESLYWKLPELLKAIEVNFKYIYLKHEKEIDKYFEARHKEFLENHTDNELKERKKELIKFLKERKEKDKYVVFNKFKNKEFNLVDFKEEDLKKKRSQYFPNMEYTFDFLLEFYQVLYDYNLILKYGYIFSDIKELLSKIDTLKNNKDSALKQVLSTEKELKKVSGYEEKKFKLFKKESNNHDLIKFKELLNRVLSEFEEYDKASFYNILATNYTNEFTIKNALELISSNYVYFVCKVKEHEDNKDINFLSSRYSELKEEVNNNNFVLLDKVALLDEYQMKQVIVDKYILDGVNLTIEELEKDNIERTLKDIKTLVDYEYILRSNIDLEDVYLYLKMRTT